MNICFDVDGTLIDYDDNPRLDIIQLLVEFADANFRITVWSGGGKNYATQVVRDLGIDHLVYECLTKDQNPPPDTAFTVDDLPDVNFGVPNLYVGPKRWDEETWDRVIEQRARVVERYP